MFSFALAGAKTPLQRCHWLKKAPTHTTTPVLKTLTMQEKPCIICGVLVNACINSSSRRLFLLFLAFGLIHFNTR